MRGGRRRFEYQVSSQFYSRQRHSTCHRSRTECTSLERSTEELFVPSFKGRFRAQYVSCPTRSYCIAGRASSFVLARLHLDRFCIF
eukprot:5434231-Pleurochrysis_carterae.AAC.1